MNNNVEIRRNLQLIQFLKLFRSFNFSRYITSMSSKKEIMKRFQKMWKSDVVKANKKMKSQMDKLVSKLKTRGVDLSNFKKLKFTEYNLSDVKKDVMDKIRREVHPFDPNVNVIRYRNPEFQPIYVDGYIKISLFHLNQFYNKRINLLSAILTAIDSL